MPRTDHSLETCKDEDGEVVCVNYSDSVCVGVRAHEWRSAVSGVGPEHAKIQRINDLGDRVPEPPSWLEPVPAAAEICGEGNSGVVRRRFCTVRLPSSS